MLRWSASAARVPVGCQTPVRPARQATLRALRESPPTVALLAGEPDHDAGWRGELWAALPPKGRVSGACPVCLAIARAERQALVCAVAVADGPPRRPVAGPPVRPVEPMRRVRKHRAGTACVPATFVTPR